MAKRRRKRHPIARLFPSSFMGWAALFFALLVIAGGSVLYIYRYAPTSEHMELSDFYDTQREDEAVVLVNGTMEDRGDAAPNALIRGEGDAARTYLEISFLKRNMDRGYLYDPTEKVLRYTTDKDVISVSLGDDFYTMGREQADLGYEPVIEDGQSVYIEADFAALWTDFSYELTVGEPNRLLIEKAGYEKETATLSKDMALRQFGGPKSKILKDGTKGEEVTVLESYGKWVRVLTRDGVLGCLQGKYLTDTKTETVAARLPEREYRHITMDETICLGWHQVAAQGAADKLVKTLDGTEGINVIAPTWFSVADNTGGLADKASMDYVTRCHERGIQVWGLFSDVENPDVSTTALLSVTSSRDNLINNIVAKAVAYGMDGVNIDFEHIEAEAGDSFVEFIKELSIKCKNNDLVLSVDYYVPTESRIAYMDYETEANYVDYMIIMAYDEHHGGDNEAGSTASISFVTNAVKTMCDYVDPSQIVLGMPFYTRIWVTEGEALTSSVLSMNKTYSYLDKHGAVASWSDELGQNYAEFTEDGKKYQIWVEDADSLSKKLNVMQENHLAGGAFWKLNLEPDSIWTVIKQYM
ncbi:MAG: hypothetical protein K5853_00770 [Lachnospiraceae bacterium]|nr:hypothetical protein [Lachnospiraceae bacterium]